MPGLVIDGSSPAVATQATGTTATVTSASFTPPANSLIVVRYAGNTQAGTGPAQPTITDNLGSPLSYHLTDWQSRADPAGADGQAAGWWANVVGSAAMTITVTNQASSGNRQAAMKILVFTDTNGLPTIGAHGKSGGTASAIAQSYTAQATGGMGLIGDCDWDVIGAQTAGTGCTLTDGGSAAIGTAIVYGFLRRTTADDVNTVSNTLNVTIPGTSTNLSWVYIEVLPAVASSQTLYEPIFWLPPWLAFELVGAGMQRMQPGTASQVTADTGLAAVGLAATSTSKKVAVVSAVCSMGLAAGGTSGKAAPAVPKAVLGLASAGTSRKAAPATAAAALGLAAAGTSRKVAPGTGLGALGLAAAGTSRKVAPAVGAAAVGLAAAGTARKLAPATGRAALGLAANGTAKKVATPTGRAALGLAGTSTAVHVAKPSGVCSTGLAAAGTSRKAAPGVGRSFIGLEGYQSGSVPRNVTAVACIGIQATSTAKHLATAAARAAVGLAASGVGRKAISITSRAALGLSATATPGGPAPIYGEMHGPHSGTAGAAAPPRMVATSSSPARDTASADSPARGTPNMSKG